MVEINQDFKIGKEYVFKINEIPELNTDNVTLVHIQNQSSILNARLIDSTSFALSISNETQDDFQEQIILFFNGISGYEDWETNYTLDSKKLYIELQINGSYEQDPFILVNNGDTSVDIYFSYNTFINSLNTAFYHCEGTEIGEYSNTVTINKSAKTILVGTILPHQKMFLKTSLDNLYYYTTTFTYGDEIKLAFSELTDFENITFEGNINALCNYNTNDGTTPKKQISCFKGLFYKAKNLKVTPDLSYIPNLMPTVVNGTSHGMLEEMFRQCSSLITVVGFPQATVAGANCCRYTFMLCKNITTVPEILPASTLGDSCYAQMFRGCSSLSTAPELPAKTLVNNCYTTIFYDCTSLNYIKAMFTTTPSTTYTNNWVGNVASSGTFVKNNAATWNVSGVNGIPDGWTVVTALS